MDEKTEENVINDGKINFEPKSEMDRSMKFMTSRRLCPAVAEASERSKVSVS
jgi:hypothetical protein